MNYTNADGLAIHPGTGRPLHQSTLPVTTEVDADDMNQIIWSLMDVLSAAGVQPANFDPDVPATYGRVTAAIKSIVQRMTIPVVPEGTRSIAGLNLDNLGLESGLYTYAHGNNANLAHPAGFPGYGLFFLILGTSFELQAIWSITQGLAFRCRFVGTGWTASPWQFVASHRALVDQFTVGGLSTWFYPVMIVPRERAFGDLAYNVGQPATYDFELHRSDVHDGGTGRGAFSLRVSCMPSRWGHVPAKVLSTNYQVGAGTGGYQAPVGNVQASLTSEACVVWLRGGGTYGLRSLNPAAPVVLRAGNPNGASISDVNNVVYSPTTQAVLPPGNIAYGRDYNGGSLPSLYGPTSWSRRPDGLIEQWGLTAVIPADSSQTILFPIAFPNQLLNVVASAAGSVINPTGESQSVGTRDHGLSGFTIVNDAVGQAVSWRALGL